MKLPVSEKNCDCSGAISRGLHGIFPNLKWYGYDYGTFLKRYKEEDYDIAIIRLL
jgi:hypothetical protein